MIHTHTIYFIVICNVAFTLISVSCCTSVISFMHLHWCYSFSTYPFVISFVTACAILPSTDYGTVGKSMGSLLAPHVLGCLTLKKKKKMSTQGGFSDWLQKIYNTQHKLVLWCWYRLRTGHSSSAMKGLH